MRFLQDGPAIPDELLWARDQGRTLFFCGAGVSRARANLPNFFGLAEAVVTKLGVSRDSPAFRLIREAAEIDRRVGISGVISADRVFGLLERDFSSPDIEQAVAEALRPAANVDLVAHKTLLDLATTPEGAVRLVTTNFDRLFDDCGRSLQTWQPPRLPDPSRPEEMNGIIYLHGRATPAYSGAEGDGFVLSSSEFGRAYLSDGWATTFIREALHRYVVVFVGYTADDPPVQYLLEALQKATGKIERAFAFQPGEGEDAAGRWRHKGVEAIPYSPNDNHSALWLSLESWAKRARDPQAWQGKVIDQARRGPASLLAYERGQVTHIVSTYEGAKKFSEGDAPPPADWLCVFDPYRRYATPSRAGSSSDKSPYIDPFDLYGLDSDVPAGKVDPENSYAKRETPTEAWDAFAQNRLDRISNRDENLAALRGHWAFHSPRLSPRISQLGVWLAKVCDQPTSVWWASHQSALHRTIQEFISWELERSKREISPLVRRAWRGLFEAWKRPPEGQFNRDWYDLKAQVEREGWSSGIVRQLGEICQPFLVAEPNFWASPIPLEGAGAEDALLRIDVRYPDFHEKLTVPNEWVFSTVEVLRQDLELAVALEREVGGYGLDMISPIVADESMDGDTYSRSHGLSGAVIRFTQCFQQLADFDRHAANMEFARWPKSDDTVFARLRIWASGLSSVVTKAEFLSVFDGLSSKAFWNIHHQRDLLLVLSRRWAELSVTARKTLERKTLKGPPRWRGEKRVAFLERRAWEVLNRIHWLADAGCRFSFDLAAATVDLTRTAPSWRKGYAARAAESLESRSGWVQTKTEHSELLGVPLSLVLSTAKAHSGRTGDFLVENDPFAGLVVERPVLAFRALTLAAKAEDIPEWAWRSFLTSSARREDRARLVCCIAHRLASYPDESLAGILRPVADWFRDASAVLARESQATFDKLARKLSGILRAHPDRGSSGVGRNGEPDWTMEAINSPAGKIAEAMFNDPRKNGLIARQGLPAAWLPHIEALLGLPGDLHRHVSVILFHNLNWFYAVDPAWTEANLLPELRLNHSDDCDAAWSGFLWGATTPNRDLYRRLKDQILALAVSPPPSSRSHDEIIAGLVLAGWGTVDERTGERLISDDEIHTLILGVEDEFRTRLLWQINHWISEKADVSEPSWKGQLLAFLKVWPRQLSVKSANVSARLCELAFASAEQFPDVVELVTPLVTTIERDHLFLPELRGSGENIVDRFPESVLSLLDKVLPDNALAWPYGIDTILNRLADAETSLRADARLIRLMTRWDAR